MSNLIYSINATLPIFLLYHRVGKVLKTTKIINDEFCQNSGPLRIPHRTAGSFIFRFDEKIM